MNIVTRAYELKQRAERQEQTRQRIIIGATRTPGFTASSTFKNRVVGPAGPARKARAGAREELEETGR